MLAGVTPIAAVCPDVPVSATVCGLPLALSVMTSDALRVPDAVGLNTTGMTAELLAATVIGEAGVGTMNVAGNPKSAGLLPPNPNPVIWRAALPVLVTVIDCGALVVPTAWLGNERLLGTS